MMKRLLLAALAALTMAGPALALDALPTSNKPKNRRVAMVRDDNWLAFTTGSQAANAIDLDRCVGDLAAAFTRQGAQVDQFTTSKFLASQNLTNSEATLWKNLGNTYGLVIVYGAVSYGTKTAGATNTTRFLRADSTNAQLMLLFGAGNRNEMCGSDTSFGTVNTTWASTSTLGVSSSGSTQFGSRIAYRPYGTTDTIWVTWQNNARMPYATASGISSVVRLLEPLALTSGLHPFASNAESTYTVLPALGDSTASSSSAGGVASLELLGPAFRTYFSNGRWVDNYLCQGYSPQYAHNTTMIPFAMAARYLALDPILISVELDDLFDMNPSHTGKRWSNSGVDSLLATFASYNCVPAISQNPLHAYEYMRGDNPTDEVAWSGPAWTWPKKWRMPWIHHSHDSTATRPTSNLVGRFGGYQNNNGSSTAVGAYVPVYAYHRMRAFGWNPGYTFHERRYGIYQRLVYSDSLRRIVCPECPVPPYLSFPNNEVLPVNWRVRTSPGNLPAYRSPAADSLCTVDSTFLAMARGLHIPKGGTLYVRAQFLNFVGDTTNQRAYSHKPWGYRSPLNSYSGNEGRWAATDTLVAFTPFSYPGEERIVRDDSGVTDPTGATTGQAYWVKVKNIAAIAYDSYSTSAQAYRFNSSRQLSMLLGFGSSVMTSSPLTQLGTTVAGSSGSDFFNSTTRVDSLGFWGLGGGELRRFSDDRPRVVFMHPLSYSGSTGTSQSGPGATYTTDAFISGILRPIRGLNALAGYQIYKWAYPWEVYSR